MWKRVVYVVVCFQFIKSYVCIAVNNVFCDKNYNVNDKSWVLVVISVIISRFNLVSIKEVVKKIRKQFFQRYIQWCRWIVVFYDLRMDNFMMYVMIKLQVEEYNVGIFFFSFIEKED